jgi:4-amino-4-deoxy-L-arabinose transferase-like glycosyltransferase
MSQAPALSPTFPAVSWLAMVRTRASLAAALGVGIAVAVGLAIRLWGIGAVGFNSDEAVYAGQAAALSGNPLYTPFFAIFRAHPLLVQFLLSLVFKLTVSDVAARLVAVAFGIAAIPLAYLLASQLFNRRVGVLAAATLAVLPYHVAVSRQVLLDGPETTLFLLTMYLIARYVATSAPRFLYLAAVAAGLTFLAKETGVLILMAIGAFALAAPAMRLGWRLFGAFGIFLLTITPYPISILVSGASDTARQFLLWQLLRRPNHEVTFYAEVLPGALGPFLLILAIAGLVLAVRVGSWQDRLLLAWTLVPLAFFQAWPVKGYQYLLPIAPALLILAARFVDRLWAWAESRPDGPDVPPLRRGSTLRASAAVLAAAMITATAVPAIATGTSALGSLAGTGGLPGGREAGAWIDANIPEGASFMTIGPTMSNIVQFYGHRKSQALSVSPNLLHRNPAYDPIPNPDVAFRTLLIQYVAWDTWSASRSPHFSAKLFGYVAKYHGRLVYEQKAQMRLRNGSSALQPVIQVYEVRP